MGLASVTAASVIAAVFVRGAECNELIVETFAQLNVRDHAYNQLIVGTIVIVVLSACVVGFMLAMRCYSDHCGTPVLLEDTRHLYQAPSLVIVEEPQDRTLSFKSAFRDDLMDGV